MAAVSGPGKTTQDTYAVAVNDRGQHALWQAGLELPPGWRRQSEGMSRQACLDAIAGAWPDIAPVSVRADAAGQRYPAGSAHPPGTPFAHELFAGQASRQPGSAAVAAGETRLTYGELDQSANRLAHYLREIGAGPETLIGVYLERGAEAVRSLLAIMKAGSGYLPLDPSLPPARLARICSETRPIAILAARPTPLARRDGPLNPPGRISGAGTRLLALSSLTAELARQPVTAPQVSLDPDNMCYAIHTSGSTGHPKAVAVSYGSLACLISELSRDYQITDRDRVIQLASLAFDTSVEQILVTLACGATLMLPPAGTIAPADLLHYVEDERVTVTDLTPAYWHQLIAITGPDDERLRSIRLMITGGEMADPADCQAAMRAAPRARLLNAYGLTETTITSALFDVGAGPEATPPGIPVPVGKPVSHTRIMVLDGKLEPVPAGTVGEIYIGGCGVARGYLGRRRSPRNCSCLTAAATPAASCTAPGTWAAGGRTATWRSPAAPTASSRCAASASSPVRSRACWPGTRTSGGWRWWRPGQDPAARAWRRITPSPARRRPAMTRTARRQPRPCAAFFAPACPAT